MSITFVQTGSASSDAFLYSKNRVLLRYLDSINIS